MCHGFAAGDLPSASIPEVGDFVQYLRIEVLGSGQVMRILRPAALLIQEF
jgi:hypothetical protein